MCATRVTNLFFPGDVFCIITPIAPSFFTFQLLKKMIKTLPALGLGLLLSIPITVTAQSDQPSSCRVSMHDDGIQNLSPEIKAEFQADQLQLQHYMENGIQAKSTADTFRFALVFHVYGTTFGTDIVSDTLIQSAVAKLNEDFHGLNNDYNSVHNQFMPIRSTMNIKFYLAQKDPNGNPTTGIIYHPVQNGFANSTGYDALIQADAWNNRKYINIYVQYDLFNNSVYNNSGYAWYPNMGMTNNNTARIVYNGQYIGSNTDPEFASTMTHELGHFFNLYHTFEGGCTMPNDYVTDTPPCTTGQGCHPLSTAMFPLNCNSQLVNSENYMDYNTQCYRMFTQGQVALMTQTMQHPARITLWQDSTLLSTGIYTPQPNAVGNISAEDDINVYPNPSKGIFTIETGIASELKIIDAVGAIVYRQTNVNGNLTIDMSANAKSLYFVLLKEKGAWRKTKLLVQ
jgi:hypothetical protein